MDKVLETILTWFNPISHAKMSRKRRIQDGS